MTSSEEEARPKNSNDSCDSPIVASRPITKLKAKQAPRMGGESVVYEEMCTLIKSLMNLLIHSRRSLGNICCNKI